jgi:hypothetical protein
MIRYTRRSQSDALAEARMQRAADAGRVFDRATVKVLLHNLSDALPHVARFN